MNISTVSKKRTKNVLKMSRSDAGRVTFSGRYQDVKFEYIIQNAFQLHYFES